MKSYKYLDIKTPPKKSNKKDQSQIDINKRNEEVYKMHKEGMPFRKIASLFNISSTKAFNIVCKIDYDKLCK